MMHKSIDVIMLSLFFAVLASPTSYLHAQERDRLISDQSRTIGKDEYEKVFEFAVSETNKAYPVILKVTTVFIANGKTVRTVTDLNENESPSHHRIKRTTVAGGRKTNNYQVSVGFGKVFCNDNGVSWKPSKHECLGPVSVYGKDCSAAALER